MISVFYLEQRSEVGAARRQDDFVRGELARAAGQGDVHEVLLLLEVPEDGQHGVGVVLPPQVEVPLAALARAGRELLEEVTLRGQRQGRGRGRGARGRGRGRGRPRGGGRRGLGR